MLVPYTRMTTRPVRWSTSPARLARADCRSSSCMSGILSIEAALGLHGTDLPARKRHGFEDAFKFEIGFAVGPLGGPGGRLRILSAIALLTHAMNNPGVTCTASVTRRQRPSSRGEPWGRKTGTTPHISRSSLQEGSC